MVVGGCDQSILRSLANLSCCASLLERRIAQQSCFVRGLLVSPHLTSLHLWHGGAAVDSFLYAQIFSLHTCLVAYVRTCSRCHLCLLACLFTSCFHAPSLLLRKIRRTFVPPWAHLLALLTGTTVSLHWPPRPALMTESKSCPKKLSHSPFWILPSPSWSKLSRNSWIFAFLVASSQSSGSPCPASAQISVLSTSPLPSKSSLAKASSAWVRAAALAWAICSWSAWESAYIDIRGSFIFDLSLQF